MKRILVAVFAFSLCTGEVLGQRINTQQKRETQPAVNLRSINLPKNIDWVRATENISHRTRIVSGFAILAGSHALKAACVATRLAPLCFPMFPVSILHNKFYTFAGRMIASKTAQGFSNGISRMFSAVEAFAKENICAYNSGGLKSFASRKMCSFVVDRGSSVLKDFGLSVMGLGHLADHEVSKFVINNLFIYAGWLGSIAINWYGSFLVRWLYDISCGGIDLGHHIIAEAHRELKLEKLRRILGHHRRHY